MKQSTANKFPPTSIAIIIVVLSLSVVGIMVNASGFANNTIENSHREHVADEAVQLGNSRVKLGSKLKIHVDANANATIEQLAQRDELFDITDSSKKEHYFEGALWLSVPVRNPHNETRDVVFQFDIGYISQASLFVRDSKTDIWQRYEAGLDQPFADRTLLDPTQGWLVPLPAQFNDTVYFRLVLESGGLPALYVSSVNTYLDHLVEKQIIMKLFYGIGFGIAAYNLILFFIVREAEYAYYLGFVLCAMGALSIAYDGFSPQLLGIHIYSAFSLIFTFAIGAHLFASLFLIHFLSLKKELPRYYGYCRWLIACLAGLFILLPFVSIRDQSLIIALSSVVTYVFLLYVAAQAWRGDNIFAAFFIASFLPLSLSLITSALSTPDIGIVTNDIIVSFMLKLSLTLQLLLLSFGLAYKVKSFEQQELTATKDLLQARLDDASQRAGRRQALALYHSKDRFLGAMNNAIRTPLNVVFGMAQLLRETPLTEEKKEYVSTIFNSGQALVRLVEDILDLQKEDIGSLSVNTEFVELSELVAVVCQLLRQNLAPGVELSYRIEEDVPQTVWLDPNRVRQVLINLVGNACKFTQQGEIEVIVTLDSDADTAQLHFEVLDTGVGISSEQCAELFESYTQSDSDVARRYSGTGLGLSISRRVVERLGGSIGVNSLKNEGSAFWFKIPIDDTEKSSPLLGTLEGGNFTGKTIGILEDSALNGRVLAGLLALFDINICTYDNISSLMADGEADKLDALVMDCRVCAAHSEQLRALFGQRKNKLNTALPLFITTTDVIGHAVEDLGLDDLLFGIIHKPIVKAQLQQTLSTQLP